MSTKAGEVQTFPFPSYGAYVHWQIEWSELYWLDKKKPMIYMGFFYFLAEQAGFEPAVGFTPRTLSRRVT
jgi:hypothetical protein